MSLVVAQNALWETGHEARIVAFEVRHAEGRVGGPVVPVQVVHVTERAVASCHNAWRRGFSLVVPASDGRRSWGFRAKSEGIWGNPMAHRDRLESSLVDAAESLKVRSGTQETCAGRLHCERDLVDRASVSSAGHRWSISGVAGGSVVPLRAWCRPWAAPLEGYATPRPRTRASVYARGPRRTAPPGIPMPPSGDAPRRIQAATTARRALDRPHGRSEPAAPVPCSLRALSLNGSPGGTSESGLLRLDGENGH
jgi:hypothetical protein